MREKLINTFFTSDFHVFVLSDKVVVRKSHSGLGAYFSTDFVVEYGYKSLDELSGILAQAAGSLNAQSSDRWFLGIPLKYFTLVNFTLPAAATENLDQAVRYSLMRHVPYDLDQAHMNYQKSQNGEILDISSVIIPINSLKPFLKAASQANIVFCNVFPSILYWARIKGDGIYISQGPGYSEAIIYQKGRITLQNWAVSSGAEAHFLEETSRLLANIAEIPENLFLWETIQSSQSIAEKLRIKPGEVCALDFNKVDQTRARVNNWDGYEITLLPRSVLRQRAMVSYMVYGGIAFFILSLLVLPVSKLAGQKRYLTKVENRVEKISSSAEEITSLRKESMEIMESIETMAEMKKSYPSTINILRELTDSIPESAWVSSLTYSDMKVTLQGEADSATSVIEAVENSPMFREVGFTSPVTKSGARDRFSLEAEVVL